MQVEYYDSKEQTYKNVKCSRIVYNADNDLSLFFEDEFLVSIHTWQLISITANEK